METSEFRFLNLTVPSGGRIPWSAPRLPRLWIYHLNYCDFLNVELTRPRDPAGARLRAALRMALDWCEQNTTGAEPGWEPYPTSLRVVNWLKFLLRNSARAEVLGEGAALARMLSSLRLQTLALERRLEKDLLANHLLKNAKALMFAGAVLDVPENRRWWTNGRRLLEREVAEQILADGGHFERSPMYHAQVLEDLLDLEALSRCAPSADSQNCIRLVSRAVCDMVSFLRSILHPDGEIPLFNDSAFGVAPPASELLARAEHMAPTPDEASADGTALLRLRRLMCGKPAAFEQTAQPECPMVEPAGPERLSLSAQQAEPQFFSPSCPEGIGGSSYTLGVCSAGATARVLAETGYGVIRDVGSRSCLILDAGPLGPDHQPGHGHCDVLSYELSLEGQRVVVDTGTSTYETGTVRHYERSTAAHNTLQIDGEEQAEIWGSFRVGRRPEVARLQAGEVRGLCLLRGEYATSSLGVVHCRTVLHMHGNCWVIVDNVRGSGLHRAQSYVHFHPAVELDMCASGVMPIPRDEGTGGKMRRQAVVSFARCRYLLVTWGIGALKLARSWYAPQFGLRLASRVLSWTWEGRLPRTTVYAFVPAVGQPPIVDLSPGGKAIKINRTIVPLE